MDPTSPQHRFLELFIKWDLQVLHEYIQLKGEGQLCGPGIALLILLFPCLLCIFQFS